MLVTASWTELDAIDTSFFTPSAVSHAAMATMTSAISIRHTAAVSFPPETRTLLLTGASFAAKRAWVYSRTPRRSALRAGPEYAQELPQHDHQTGCSPHPQARRGHDPAS